MVPKDEVFTASSMPCSLTSIMEFHANGSASVQNQNSTFMLLLLGEVWGGQADGRGVQLFGLI